MGEADPELIAFLDGARDRLEPRLVMVDVGGVRAGRKPPWWQEDWT